MQLLIVAGTTEGRELLETLLFQNEWKITVCVATEYGASLLPQDSRLTVLTGRLDEAGMTALLRDHPFAYAVDATHPYAAEVTRNLHAACQETGTPYLRLRRESQGTGTSVNVPDAKAAAAFLNTVPGAVLLTTGSKELAAFTSVERYRERLFARVLPTASVLAQCESLGFSGKHLIAMQGPFTEELNLALLRQTGASWLVTKDSGAPGGLEEKCRAAQRAGARVLCIGRPEEPQETGYSMQEIFALLCPKAPQEPAATPYFPLFVSLRDKHIVVVGAGTIARRRVETLLPFGCAVTVIAPESQIPPHPQVHWEKRNYQPGDLAQANLALAATNDRAVNHAVFLEATRLGIPVNIADAPLECSFFFPAIIQQGNAVLGVTASGTDHSLARSIAQRVRELRENIFSTEKGACP